MAVGYAGLPNIARPAPLKRPGVTPATHEGSVRGNPSTVIPVKPKGKTTTHPTTGLPVMQSPASIRAAANAQAWKTIQQQQDLLPSEGDIVAQYGAKAAAIQPLIDAHRGWLEKAGEYTVSMANGLASMGQTAATAADTTAGQGAAAAGAGVGMNTGPSVSPAGVGMPAAVYGTSTANYLHSLVPYADALGGQSIAKVNSDQSTALDDLRTSKQKIASGLGDLEATNYKDLTASALDVFKSKIATLAASEKNTTKTASDAAALAEKTRHDQATEATAARNATTSEEKAKAATQLTKSKLTATGMTPAEVKSFQGFLKDTDKKYQNLGGTKVPGRYEAVATLPAHKGATAASSTGKLSHSFAGKSIAEVQASIKSFMASHNKPKLNPATGNLDPGAWSVTPVAAQKNSTVTVGKKGEATRRLDAWRYLVAQNSTLGQHALSEADLRAAFRRMEGAPPGSKK